MEELKYMKIPVAMIPEDIMEQYKLASIVKDGIVMVEIRKGKYGLPQAGILAYNLLCARLVVGDYYPAPHTPGLFVHKTRQIDFSLWVENTSRKKM